MARVLHLLDQNADFPTRRLAVSLAEQLRDQFAPIGLTIGRGGDLRNVLDAGRCLDHFESAAVIHAWGTRPLIAAALAGRQPFVYSPPAEFNRWDRFWMRWICKRGVSVVFSSESQRRRSHLSRQSRIIRPGVQVNAPEGPYPPLRQWLGYSDNDFVVLAPGESTRSAGHDLAVWITAIAHMHDPTWRLLIWGRGDRVEHLHHITSPLRLPGLIRFQPSQEFGQLIPAADVVLTTRGGADADLPTALCMAESVPVIEIGKPRETAQKLLDLRNDATLRKTLQQSAAADAAKFFDMDRFARDYAAMYRQCLPADAPANAPPVAV
jgi:hypothetical protein